MVSKNATDNKNKKAVNQTGKVTDPDYPDGMWLDPDDSHYSFNYLLNGEKTQQLIFSTDRNGSGVVFVYLIDNETHAVIENHTLQKNEDIQLSNEAHVYNDDYAGVVRGAHYQTWSKEYATGAYVPGNQHNNLTFFVPEKVVQTVSYVDENGNDVIDKDGNQIAPVTQYGLTGQRYTTDGPKVVNGYYVVSPENASGTMSQFGIPGKQYTRDFHDGYKAVFTEVDGKGTMDVVIHDPNNEVVFSHSNLQKDEVLKGAYKEPSGTSLTLSNPYVEQSRDVQYVYHELGSLVPDVPGVEPVPYPNDPEDPEKPGEPTIPAVPGYTPEDPDGNPLTPGDTYPVDPTKPGEDTPIHYAPNEQKGSVTYVDVTTGETITVDQLTGKSDETSDYRTQDRINQLVNQGYELVSDNYPADGVVFDHDDDASQDFTVTLQHKTTTVTPENPGDPEQPIDPENPEGPKYPNGTDYDSLHHDVNQVVHYVDEAGNEMAADVTDQVSFERTGTVDEVTGEVTYAEWQAVQGDDTFDAKPTPVVNGYYADQANVPAQTVTAGSADQTETVIYHELGSLVPDVPGVDPVPYPNDPEDPTKPSDPTIPEVPGYTPEDLDGNPLTPGDTYPVDPENPGENTPIHYVINETIDQNDPTTPDESNYSETPDDNSFMTEDERPMNSENFDNSDMSTSVRHDGKQGTSTNDAELPKTNTENDQNDNIAASLLAMLGSILGLFGLSFKKSSKKEEK